MRLRTSIAIAMELEGGRGPVDVVVIDHAEMPKQE